MRIYFELDYKGDGRGEEVSMNQLETIYVGVGTTMVI